MKTTLLFILSVVLHLNSYSQSIFQTEYGNNDVIDIKEILLANNYYYIVGQTTNPTNYDADISFFCVDNDGGLLWSVLLGTDKDDFVKSFIATADGLRDRSGMPGLSAAKEDLQRIARYTADA